MRARQALSPPARSSEAPWTASSHSLRIVLFTDTFLPSRNGVALSVATFAESLRRQGDEVLIVAPGAPGAPATQPGVYRTLSFRWRGAPDYPLALPWGAGLSHRLRAFRPQVIHAHSPNLLGRAALWFARALHCPLAYTYHTLLHEYARHYAPLAPGLAVRLFRQVTRDYARRANVVIAPTASAARLLERLGTGREVRVAPTGIRAPSCWPDRSRARARLGWRDDDLGLLFVGRVSPEKNIDFLLTGFRRLRRSFPRARLALVGGGAGLEHYRERAGQMDLDEAVLFSGSMDPERVWEFYAAADLYVSTSRTETQGLTFGEAMLAGLPCVTLAACGAAEMVRDGETGLVAAVDLDSWTHAVARLLLDGDLRRRMGQAGRGFVHRTLDPDRCARRLRAIYLDALRAYRA